MEDLIIVLNTAWRVAATHPPHSFVTLVACGVATSQKYANL